MKISLKWLLLITTFILVVLPSYTIYSLLYKDCQYASRVLDVKQDLGNIEISFNGGHFLYVEGTNYSKEYDCAFGSLKISGSIREFHIDFINRNRETYKPVNSSDKFEAVSLFYIHCINTLICTFSADPGLYVLLKNKKNKYFLVNGYHLSEDYYTNNYVQKTKVLPSTTYYEKGENKGAFHPSSFVNSF